MGSAQRVGMSCRRLFFHDAALSMENELNLPMEAVRDLVAKTGLGGPFHIEPLAGGRNNRVFRIESAGRLLLLKSYFHHDKDRRDRLKREFQFLQCLWSNGIRAVPEPVAADYGHRLGVYEFVRGRKLRVQEIQDRHIDQAIAFCRSINLLKNTAWAQQLPAASEACFSIAEHLGSVDRRVERLKTMPVASDIDTQARHFLREELIPLWNIVRGRVRSEYERNRLLHKNLQPASRCLSPSDFGYHNALMEESGMIRFLDFEYAGWDDAAKLVCDFANQPDMLLPEELSFRFQSAVINEDEESESLRRRILWLTPVYQVKWACILLNDFLPEGRSRILFIQGEGEKPLRKRAQVLKARQMLVRSATSFGTICESSMM